ncbi:MAG: indole-3-glycerol phosphate synthase TrpC [Pseudanabaena sp.]|jgi:indole-3-glycerol phosphate synthase|uniref:indole-3-glycerol phosphate synthase TrpC n=1 Tax=Pseudanabaena mucicola TaxID=71190 RepID=UPI002578350B|nr:indole-3-glycerol phosphate synthase TrpC [Pseudanabaena mucicola]MCA6572854.1 indole-3-glycerol phosphate synthase TrpC [Pseudanabaena sp. M53BS1SP1A06MG]MCA6581301.1 indole-3-glycerol phosphate synthase TrpC [Pseudanabaena sp. M34BS1SP1A06MG]MCA6587867.1 indole-3-glycerol phosphate synthase TrpC [Pseudanabaena sp. M109S1SP1A06QC]MCA6590626.1 indole-3-glycerol phosphate synthase TrpC [Pseudanabaena sp. M38BS1SP1A06MG]MCA6596280.1 indole-3-glycerol phosphate synthase TrpC [Pseudanabaena sp.
MQVRRQSEFARHKGYEIASITDVPQNILEKIVWQKEREVAQMYANESLDAVKAKLVNVQPARDFYGRLQNSLTHPALIAEVKKASPSKGVFREDFNPQAIAKAYEIGGASCLSVLTDADFFQGGFENLQLVRQVVDLPLLCKEFIIDPYQIYWGRSHGADAILLITAILTDADLSELQALIHQLGMTALVEVHTQEELDRVLQIPDVRLIGINNRNLENFVVELEQTKVLMDRLDPDTRNKYLWVSESGIYTRQDLDFVKNCGASAVLVGESLIKQENIKEAVKSLIL